MDNKLISKLNIIRNNIGSENLCCPICKKNIFLNENSLICEDKHTFDFNKKGYIKLLKTYKNHFDKIYTSELFLNRKTVILQGFYQELHKTIQQIINNKFNHKINILDIGAGEGSHTKIITENINFDKCYLTDITEDAIKLSTQYLSKKIIPIVCDAYNLPFKKCFDVILDILSPYSYKEIYSVLKDNGIFIKVVPNKNYLKEIRNSNNMKEYTENESVLINFATHFNVVQKFNIDKTFNITEEQSKAFTKMTPLTESLSNVVNPNKITISLCVLVGEKK